MAFLLLLLLLLRLLLFLPYHGDEQPTEERAATELQKNKEVRGGDVLGRRRAEANDALPRHDRHHEAEHAEGDIGGVGVQVVDGVGGQEAEQAVPDAPRRLVQQARPHERPVRRHRPTTVLKRAHWLICWLMDSFIHSFIHFHATNELVNIWNVKERLDLLIY